MDPSDNPAVELLVSCTSQEATGHGPVSTNNELGSFSTTSEIAPVGAIPSGTPTLELDNGTTTDDASVGSPSAFSTGGLSVDDGDADPSVGDIELPQSNVSTNTDEQYVEEQGRTYHKYKKGKYFLPNDIPERERLNLQHTIAVRLLGGLSLAPVSNPPRVLDIGTGTGIWCIEFAEEHPGSDILGVDLSPIQPDHVPSNCHFAVGDVDEDWNYPNKFDYIHSRFMVAAFTDFAKIFRHCYENLQPGGWVEFQEYYVPFQCADASFEGTAIQKWNRLFLEAVDKLGRHGTAAAHFKRQMAEAGFVDVVERKFALPSNPWPKGEREKMLGFMQMTNISDGLQGMTMTLFTKVLGWSVEQVEALVADVRMDLRNTKIHVYYVLYAVYGRKPLSAQG